MHLGTCAPQRFSQPASIHLPCCCVQLREEKQKEWEQRFAQALQRRESSHSDTSWLQSMPKHCVQESAAKGILIGSGLACAGVQVLFLLRSVQLLAELAMSGHQHIMPSGCNAHDTESTQEDDIGLR